MTISDNGSGLLSFDGHRGSETLTFNASNWNVFQTVQVAGFDDGVIRGFHPSDLLATGLGNYSYLSTVTIGDNHYAGRHGDGVRRHDERRRVPEPGDRSVAEHAHLGRLPVAGLVHAVADRGSASRARP